MKYERSEDGRLKRPEDEEFTGLLPGLITEAYYNLVAREEAKRRYEAEREPIADLDDLYLDRAALDSLPAPDPLIPSVLPRHAYGVLRGRDQSFKSFVALDWALTLATGSLWNLMPVARVPVLYIAGEGAWGLRARVAAWEERHQVRVDPAAFTVRQVALNLHRPGPAFDHLLKHVTERGYGLVVVDTLRRVSGAADGNGSEMGAVVDSLDQVKQATADGTVLVVAHTDKGDNDSRGYSGIEDDADFVWHARRDSNRLELELTKMKDGPDGVTLHMQAWPVGDSMVLAHAVKPAVSDKAPESEATLLATLRSTFPEGAYSGQLKEAAGLPSTTYHRALAALKARGELVNSGSHQRPFYEATSLTGPTDSHRADSPSDLHESHSVPSRSQRVPLLPRPLGSGSHGSETPKQERTQPSAAGDPGPDQGAGGMSAAVCSSCEATCSACAHARLFAGRRCCGGCTHGEAGSEVQSDVPGTPAVPPRLSPSPHVVLSRNAKRDQTPRELRRSGVSRGQAGAR